METETEAAATRRRAQEGAREPVPVQEMIL